jgi:hypothetical protein
VGVALEAPADTTDPEAAKRRAIGFASHNGVSVGTPGGRYGIDTR